MKQRKSNLELMRLLMICTVPIFHLMLYNNVFSGGWSPTTITALILCAGGAIPADYAFISLSCYFFCKKKNAKLKDAVRKVINIAVLTGVLWLLRYIILHGLYGKDLTNDLFVGLFLLHGAWWYIYAYVVMAMIYPFVNWLLQKINFGVHCLLWAASLVLFIAQGLENKMCWYNDVLAFLFIYLTISAVLRKRELGKRKMGDYKKLCLVGILLCYAILLAICCYVKYPAFNVSADKATNICLLVMGRYNFIAAIDGMLIFVFFLQLELPYIRGVNKAAHYTIYILLLHETCMGIIGKCFGHLVGDVANYSVPQMLLWSVLYLLATFVFSICIGWIYENTIEKLVLCLNRRLFHD